MNVRHITIRAILTTSLAVLASTASAQFAPRISGEDIEGAIMPAIPFPSSDRNTTAATRAPQTMGLAPSSEPAEPVLSLSSEEREPVKPVVRRRAFSAQETADRLLAQ